MGLRLLFLLAACVSLPLAAQETPVRILPANPQAGEAFAVIGAYGYNRGGYFTTTAASRAGNVLEISQPHVLDKPYYEQERWARYGTTIPGLEAGVFTIRGGHFLTEFGTFGDTPGTPPYEMQVTVGPATTIQPRFRELDGNWFDPAQAGWGVNIVQGDSGALFAIWMTYGEKWFRPDGAFESEWLAIPAGRWIDATTFRGLLYESAGAQAGQPSRSSMASPVGLATLEFLGNEQVKFSIVRATLMGTWFERQWTLKRFAF